MGCLRLPVWNAYFSSFGSNRFVVGVQFTLYSDADAGGSAVSKVTEVIKGRQWQAGIRGAACGECKAGDYFNLRYKHAGNGQHGVPAALWTGKDTTLIIIRSALERRCWWRSVEKMSLVDGIKLLGIVEKSIT